MRSGLRNETVTGLLLAGFALALHLYIIPTQVDTHGQGPIALSPRLFCHITAGLLLILSLSLAVSGLRAGARPDRAGSGETLGNILRGGAALGISAGYVIAIPVLGYFTSTIVFMAVFLWFCGVRSWKGGLVFLAVILPFVYLLFVKMLSVILPSGLLF